jgi:outer membrane protein
LKGNPATLWTITALLLASGPAMGQVKIGYVSVARILSEAPAAQRAQKKIEQEFSKRNQELSRMAEQLKKMQENLEKNAVTMPESDRLKREREFGELNRDFQRKQREFREDLNQRQNEELAAVFERVKRAVDRIADTDKLDVVFRNEQVVWASTRVDITDRVIKALDDARPAK